MKLLLVLFLFQGCASWKQRDFKKELEKSKEVEATVKVDETLREKFEVKPVDEKKVAETTSKSKRLVVNSKNAIKPSQTIRRDSPKKTDKTVPSKDLASSLPADYTEDLKVLNEKAKKVWEQYVPRHNVDEKIYLDINYLGMTVGKIMFTNKGKRMINDREVWHFHARFKSAPFYSKIYELDDTVDTYVTTDQFLSIRYSLVQRESKQDIDDLQLHDREKLKTFWFYKQKKSDGTIKEKQKEAYIPFYSTDPFSALFLFQGLPLKDADEFEIPVLNKGKILILKSKVEGRETISTARGNKKAIRIHATTKYSGEHLKSGEIYMWFADDEKRTVLKISAKIKIGSVNAEIVEGE